MSLELDFEDVSISVRGSHVGYFSGVAEWDISDGETEAHMARITLEPTVRGEAEVCLTYGNARKEGGEAWALFMLLRQALFDVFATDIEEYEAASAPAELGYGHQQRELV